MLGSPNTVAGVASQTLGYAHPYKGRGNGVSGHQEVALPFLWRMSLVSGEQSSCGETMGLLCSVYREECWRPLFRGSPGPSLHLLGRCC